MSEHRRVGDTETIKYVWLWRECQECGLPARYRHTFLLHNARSNPASAGYRGDDISWCSDEDAYACEKCKGSVERDVPAGHSWCATFSIGKKRFQHMGFYKRKISEATA